MRDERAAAFRLESSNHRKRQEACVCAARAGGWLQEACKLIDFSRTSPFATNTMEAPKSVLLVTSDGRAVINKKENIWFESMRGHLKTPPHVYLHVRSRTRCAEALTNERHARAAAWLMFWCWYVLEPPLSRRAYVQKCGPTCNRRKEMYDDRIRTLDYTLRLIQINVCKYEVCSSCVR